MNRNHVRANVGATGRSPLRVPPRRSIRLRGYDYSQAGAYFVTICTQNRKCLFGDVVDGEMVLNEMGNIVANEWIKTAEIRHEIELDEWIVMPNHFHGIVVITGTARQLGSTGDRPVARTGPIPRSLGAVMAGFKSAVTKRITEMRGTPGAKLWQCNYWDHVVRNENELSRIREYIVNNPAKWEWDKLYSPSSYGHGVPCPGVREPSTEYGTEEWMV